MSFLKDLAKGIGNHVMDHARQFHEWKEEAEMMDDEELVRRLNSSISTNKKSAYASVAKERGTIGRRDGRFFVRY